MIAEHGEDLTFDVLNELDALHDCIQEALRLQPPLVLLMRYAKEPFEVTSSDGRSYVVPKVQHGGAGWDAGAARKPAASGPVNDTPCPSSSFSSACILMLHFLPQYPHAQGWATLPTPPNHPRTRTTPRFPPPNSPQSRALLQGDIVATSPSFSHRLQHVFKDADRFQPERFRGLP